MTAEDAGSVEHEARLLTAALGRLLGGPGQDGEEAGTTDPGVSAPASGDADPGPEVGRSPAEGDGEMADTGAHDPAEDRPPLRLVTPGSCSRCGGDPGVGVACGCPSGGPGRWIPDATPDVLRSLADVSALVADGLRTLAAALESRADAGTTADTRPTQASEPASGQTCGPAAPTAPGPDGRGGTGGPGRGARAAADGTSGGTVPGPGAVDDRDQEQA